jgi:hypothetical protein
MTPSVNPEEARMAFMNRAGDLWDELGKLVPAASRGYLWRS